MGRWVRRDPIGEKGGLNVYAFVGNKQLKKVDAVGLAPAVCGIDENGMPIYCPNPPPCYNCTVPPPDPIPPWPPIPRIPPRKEWPKKNRLGPDACDVGEILVETYTLTVLMFQPRIPRLPDFPSPNSLIMETRKYYLPGSGDMPNPTMPPTEGDWIVALIVTEYTCVCPLATSTFTTLGPNYKGFGRAYAEIWIWNEYNCCKDED